jgi:hypothetical protein
MGRLESLAGTRESSGGLTDVLHQLGALLRHPNSEGQLGDELRRRALLLAEDALRLTNNPHYPHWQCSLHGKFDARHEVGCPTCMIEARRQLRVRGVV